ncbi:beta-1,6-N-acetylglucosaminyltransferase [Halomonas sp. I1]|uniref:beta-1,6-N-acetylglucosaminyltransferase n=1 Tax=Halomonas sp. I1 TaxID=393536 RepID=UPI0028DDEEB2|nr:beta-1,6-N-acetylglucosaminyltransferase [Halomonas sp. I1]MDT8894901.1 beta-1,6-N-acetylglucosaminyltransferase [Halomonas sp. I1]
MKISFVLLAHEPPDQLYHLIKSLLSSGSDIYVHYDAGSPHDLEAASRDWGLDDLLGTLHFADRVDVVWGEWSIIQATLNCLYLARSQRYGCDCLMLISGSCMPVKPVDSLRQHLVEAAKDHIEAVNAEANRWVTDGIQKERWEYYHIFNWRFQEFRFRASNKLQKLLGVKRQLPLGHTAHMGSQWWCLRTKTVDAVLRLIDENEEMVSFYRRTWVPDELFFQTLVANLVSSHEISMAPLTRYQFNSKGVPRVYYDDALPELLGETQFFARKISPRALSLKQSLASIGAMSQEEYRGYVDTNYDEFRLQFVDSLELSLESQANAWHSLVLAPSEPADFCKRIPMPLVVICSLDGTIKQQVRKSCANLPGAAVHGDILESNEIDFGDGKDMVLGYRRDNPAVARHRWHFFLGDLAAYHAQDNCMLFTMGEEAVEYLDALRWTHGLTVIALVDKSPLAKKGYDLRQLFEFSQFHRREHEFNRRLQELMADRYCDYYVVDASDHDRVTDIVMSRMR